MSLFDFTSALSNDPFDKFWAKYPRKVAKVEARKAWDCVIKKFEPHLIHVCLERQLSDWKHVDETYIPHAATWLRRTDFVEEQKPAAEPVQRWKYCKQIITWQPHEKPPDWEPLLADEFARMLEEAKGKNRI